MATEYNLQPASDDPAIIQSAQEVTPSINISTNTSFRLLHISYLLFPILVLVVLGILMFRSHTFDNTLFPSKKAFYFIGIFLTSLLVYSAYCFLRYSANRTIQGICLSSSHVIISFFEHFSQKRTKGCEANIICSSARTKETATTPHLKKINARIILCSIFLIPLKGLFWGLFGLKSVVIAILRLGARFISYHIKKHICSSVQIVFGSLIFLTIYHLIMTSNYNHAQTILLGFLLGLSLYFFACSFSSIFLNTAKIIKSAKSLSLNSFSKHSLVLLYRFSLVSLCVEALFPIYAGIIIKLVPSLHLPFVIIVIPLTVLSIFQATRSYIYVTNALFDYSSDFFRDSSWVNTPLFHLYWRKGNSYLWRLTYVMLPFFFIVTLGAIIISSDGFTGTNTNYYYFVQDISNCFMICYIFLFMYFVNGLFVYHFNRNTDRLVSRIDPVLFVEKKGRFINLKRKYQRTTYWVTRALTVIYIPFALGAMWTMRVAKRVGGENYWYHEIHEPGFTYYSVIIALSWILSARLFISIIINSVTIFHLSRDNKVLFGNNESRSNILKPLKSQLAASLGFGVYFLIAIGMILFSDIYAHGHFEGIEFGVYEHRWLVIGAAILLSAFYFSTVIMGYIAITDMINDNSSGIYQEERAHRVDANSFGAFLLTILFPGIAALIQILTPLSKWVNFLNNWTP